MFCGLNATYIIITDKIVLIIMFEYMFNLNVYSVMAYIAPIKLEQNILKYDILTFAYSIYQYSLFHPKNVCGIAAALLMYIF